MPAITVQDVVNVAPELATFAAPVTAWAVSTAYTLGAQRSNGPNVYTCTVAGTSAASGAGPEGLGSAITDGTVTWAWASLYGVATIERAILEAENIVAECLWGDSYEYALALLSAHLVLASQPQLGGLVAGGGVLQSITLGSMSKSFASGGSTTAFQGPHSNTRPGALYDARLATISPGLLYL